MSNSQILHDFYSGNLAPADKRMIAGSEIARAADEASRIETALEQSIAPELLPLLRQLAHVQTMLNGITAEIYYVDGFKTGARFMLAVQDDACEDLKPVTA